MQIKASTALRTLMLDGASLREVFTAAAASEIRIFGGTPPATADAAQSATLLATLKNGSAGVSFGEAVNATINKATGETWSGSITTGGTATHYRLVLGADTGADDAYVQGGNLPNDPRIQGTIGQVTGAVPPGDLNLQNVVLTQGGTQTIDIFTIQFPG